MTGPERKFAPGAAGQPTSGLGTALPVMIALDVPDGESALQLAARFAGIPVWMKVGMELFYAAGPDVVRRLKAQGHRMFLDLKFHDIPNTVRGAARSAARLGVDMINVHAAGGTAMMRAALEGAREGAAEAGVAPPLVIAVTMLTSTSEETMRSEIGIDAPLGDVVLRYARLAREAGLAGVVCSAREAAAVKAACGAEFVTVTPGIRPAGSDAADQARVMTPSAALAAGADYLVVGRPVTQAADPRAALLRLAEEIGAGTDSFSK